MEGGDDTTDFIDDMDDFLTTEEKKELNEQFIKDNFCPFDEDPFIYEHKGINLFQFNL